MKKLISLVLVISFMLTLTGCGNKDYKIGMEAFESGDYDKAIFYLSQDPTYKDAAEKIKESRDKLADGFAKEGRVGELFELLEKLTIEEIHEYDDKLVEAISKDLATYYQEGNLESFQSVVGSCNSNYRMLVELGFDEKDPMVSSLKALVDDRMIFESVKTYSQWFPNAVLEINDLFDGISDALNSGTVNDVKAAGQKLYDFGQGVAEEYSSDDYSMRIGLTLREAGGKIVALASAKTQAQAEKLGNEFGELVGNYSKILLDIMEESLVVLGDLDAINNTYNLDLSF